MDKVTLGRSGLTVSVVGLGCGGDSHLGLDTGGSPEQATAVLRRALDLGISYFDTADEYGTEELVGVVLAPVRDEVTISTKSKPRREDGSLLDAACLRSSVEASLEKLRTDYVDLYFLHMVRLRDYDHCLAELVPVLVDLRDKGVLRHLAITEGSRSDPRHEMLQRAVKDDIWEVMMLAFNPFNQSARRLLFPQTIAANIGTDVMCAARGPFSHPDEMRDVVARLIEAGELDGKGVDRDDPVGFVVHEGGAESVIDGAYRFARHEPGCDVILTGTGNTRHLDQNVASINRRPLPDADRDRLERLFGHLQRLTKD